MAKTNKEAKPSLEKQIEEKLGVSIKGKVCDWTYDEWLEYFRKVPHGKLLAAETFLDESISGEGFSAAERWIELAEKPGRMDKLQQGRLRAKSEQSLMEIATGDSDEAVYEALIRKNVEQLDSSTNSAQETARLTQNINIFRQQLADIRSRKPKEGSVLDRVLKTLETPKPEHKKATKPKKKRKKNEATQTLNNHSGL